jgi:hypothetical protein
MKIISITLTKTKTMKKLFSFAILALVCTSSFGQKITSINFNGMLASTTYSQFNSGASTIGSATTGWVSAIAAPNATLSNLPIILGYESFSSSGAVFESSPSPASPLATNYTDAAQFPSGSNVYWAYSQNYTKVSGVYTTPTPTPSWRTNQIFINPLTISSLPIVVLNTASLQPGFSFCGEPANSNTSIQLHTNNQAVCMAFNSVADVVKLQLENVGNATVVSGALIVVEKSADLITWTPIQNIDIANQPLSSALTPAKQDYTLAVNDVTARYIRIKISGVPSRSSRKENLRNVAVLSKPAITWSQDLTKFTIADIGGTETILTATSSSSADTNSAPITYTSSDSNVVSVVDNKLSVVGAGTAVITATQVGNTYYSAAADVTQNVTVSTSLGIDSINKEKEINFIYVTREGIVSNIEGTLQVYAINGVLLKNIAVSKNQVIPVAKGVYIVRTFVNGKSVSKKIIK